MACVFESDYRAKVLRMRFEAGTVLATAADVQAWRAEWLAALASWHSPYKALIDCTGLEIPEPVPEDVKKALALMMQVLGGLFLRKAAGFGGQRSGLPFPVFATEDEAAKDLGIRDYKVPVRGDFRSLILIDNHFEQQVVELHFAELAVLDAPDKFKILKDKMMNNLMQWHSGWNLLIDCANLQIAEDQHAEFEKIIKFLKTFFLKEVIGYGPLTHKASWPFKTFRARHRAAGELKGEVKSSGREANCNSRK